MYLLSKKPIIAQEIKWYGIRGNKVKGRLGLCDAKCGQKICYLNAVDYANEIFKNRGFKKRCNNWSWLEEKPKITNRDFLKKLQKMCISDEYYDILTKKR